MNISKRLSSVILFFLIATGIFLRFYNLNWDQGIGFNPDERDNIIIPALQTNYPNDPKIYTYGSLTIYLYKGITSFLANIFNQPSIINASTIFIVGRAISATLSAITVYITYFISKKIYSHKIAVLASVFTSLSVGLIQAAHFATTETIITLAGLLIVQASFFVLKNKGYYNGYIWGGLIFGLAISAKASALIFFPSLFFAHFLSLTKKNFLNRTVFLFMGVIVCFTVMFISSPHVFINYNDIIESFNFQKQIATGQIEAFWTTQFINTTPYLFQVVYIFPWVLGFPLVVMGFLGLSFELVKLIKHFNKKTFIFLFTFCLYFIYTGSLFVKWTRYIIPLLPFICIFAAISVVEIKEKLNKKKRLRLLTTTLVFFLMLYQFLYTIAYANIYKKPDTRLIASEWIIENVPRNSTLLSEPHEPAYLPLSISNTSEQKFNIKVFNYYKLDTSDVNSEINDLSQEIHESDYIIISSRRIFANRMRLSNIYPLTTKYYQLLFSGKLGFKQVKKITSFPNLLGNELDDEKAEETWSVFDHPVIRIYKKVNPLTQIEYETLLSS